MIPIWPSGPSHVPARFTQLSSNPAADPRLRSSHALLAGAPRGASRSHQADHEKIEASPLNTGRLRPQWTTRKRLAIIVSHPIQYYIPLYQRLAQRDDLIIKVFYTWHVGHAAVEDRGFKTPVAWDIPLTEGYEFELIQNGGHPSFFWP